VLTATLRVGSTTFDLKATRTPAGASTINMLVYFGPPLVPAVLLVGLGWLRGRTAIDRRISATRALLESADPPPGRRHEEGGGTAARAGRGRSDGAR
jgi:hypothetical protein